MRVRVIAPAFCDHTIIDDRGMVELAQGTRLSGLLKMLKIPSLLRTLIIVRVNYDKVGNSYMLQEDDTVSLFWPMSGG